MVDVKRLVEKEIYQSLASLPGEKRSGLLGLLGIGALKRLPAVVES